jgi:hypothetical protein
MRGVFLTETAVFFKLKPLGLGLFVFRGRIVPALALGAGEGDNIPHS